MDFHIYKCKNGKYAGKLNICQKINAKPKYKYIYAHSYEECIAKIKIFRTANFKKNISLASVNISFQDISHQWLSFNKAYTKQSTYAVYSYILRRYLNPVFGKNEFQMINEMHINKFIHNLLIKGAPNSKKPLSPKTVHNITIILKMIFAFAERQYSFINPAKNIHITKINSDKKFLSDKHWYSIRSAAQKDKSLTATAICIAVYTGMRIGEICALQKKDIDFDNNILYVCKTVQRISCGIAERKTKLIISEPKSSTSHRCIPIPDILIPRLRTFCQEFSSDEFLFGINNTALDPRTLQYRFRKFLQNNDIPVINFHQLRHKFAGSCVENNIDVKVLSEILGHSNVSITLNYYVHPTMDFKRKQLNMAIIK